uniref:Uncharacterized protein n=1 Tax=Rhizophora mucronata TaxID=61149 RepID=A0A2P2MYN5_RHIMU
MNTFSRKYRFSSNTSGNKDTCCTPYPCKTNQNTLPPGKKTSHFERNKKRKKKPEEEDD